MRWLPALIAILWCSPALAGVVWVPSPPLVGDGTTQSAVRFYVDDGARLRVKAEDGKTGSPVQGADGVWTVPFTPPRVGQVGTITFKVTSGGVDSTFDVPVAPPLQGSVAVSFDPPLLSSTGTATVRIEPQGTSPLATEGRRFLLSASAGTVDAVVPAGGGAWVARYTPPKGLAAPLSVVFAAADAAAPDQVFGSAVLPVTVKRSVSFDVQAGSSNVLKVGARQYGPLVAAPSGKVAFDVDLDPREATGQLKSVNPDTSKADKEVPLPVAASTALVFHPLPATAPAQADLAVPVRFVVVGADGRPKTAGTAVKLTASRGTLTEPVLDRHGYVATFTPPSTPGDVVIVAEVEGAKAEGKLRLVGSVPTVTLNAPAIGKSSTSFSVTARVKDAQGTGVVGKPPTLSAEGASVAGSAKDNKDGSYTVPFKVSSSAKVARVFASPAVETSSMPASRLVAWPAIPSVTANGADVVTITVVSVDAFGIPVPNVNLKLGSPRGDGAVPPLAKTDARGMARIPFTAGKAPGVVSVRIEGAGLVTEVPLFQAAPGQAGVALPTGGGPVDEALVEKWKAAAPVLEVYREGAAPAPVVAPTAVTPPPEAAPAGSGKREPASGAPRREAASGGAGGGSAPVKAPKPARALSSGEWAALRVGGGLLNARGSYTMESDAGAQLLGTAEYATPGAGFFGLGAELVWLPLQEEWGGLGLDVRGRGQLEWFNVGDTPYVNVQRDAILGARYRRGIGGTFSVEGSLAAHYTTGVLFRYADAARSEAELLNFPLFGARLGGLLSLETDRVYASLELAETFAPFPIDTHAEAMLDWRLGNQETTLRFGAAWDYRTMKYAADGGGDTGAASVTQNQFTIKVGAGRIF